jgi:Spy/CpxP family protein refolding chaperone
MKTSRLAFALGLALLAGAVTTTSIAVAQDVQQPSGRQGWQDRMLSRLQQKLNLTNDQVTSIREVQNRHRDARIQVAKALHQARAQYRTLAVTGTDDAALQQKAAEIQSLTGQSLQLYTQTLRETAQVLTPEQRTAFAQMSMGGWRHGQRGPTGQPS